MVALPGKDYNTQRVTLRDTLEVHGVCNEFHGAGTSGVKKGGGVRILTPDVLRSWWFNGGLTNKNGDFNGMYPLVMTNRHSY